MLPTTLSGLTDTVELDAEIDLLAAVKPTDAPLLSCYLDARLGRAACEDFLESKAEAIRNAVSGATRFASDTALNMVQRQLEQAWSPDMLGLAVFARGHSDSRFLRTVPLAVPVSNRLILYRVPEIVPLLALRERNARFTILLVRESGVQVLDVELGKVAPTMWASLPRVVRSSKRLGIRAPKRLDRSIRVIRRALLSRLGSPLVLAGDERLLDEAVSWLPRRVRVRGVEQFELPPDLSVNDAVGEVREHLTARRDRESAAFTERLLRELRPRGEAVAGPAATEQALRGGRVETLVVSERLSAGEGSWDPRIELSRTARQQGIRIVASESDELSYLGGVACVLRRSSNRQVLSLPARRLEPAA